MADLILSLVQLHVSKSVVMSKYFCFSSNRSSVEVEFIGSSTDAASSRRLRVKDEFSFK